MQELKTIKKIIVHCSATPEGKDYSAKDIDKWHKERGWECIGYHYVIKLDGTIEGGRSVKFVGAHCKGHNSDSLGICYIGGLDKDHKPKDTRTPEQKEAIKSLCLKLLKENLAAKLYGHRDFESKKDCPCFDVIEEALEWEITDV
ncbi:N-acetylmuramoyl-L-alanine amidase [Helicobacter suis]|uniref:N-acetylmuramoyl-L-alanine amidase n=1 Tax=Helicobacter suis TaxID=104628 RepID=UPI0013D8C714|nr:N-acetylmuramoyl-L-alanine amidase [Helicobacter suis]